MEHSSAEYRIIQGKTGDQFLADLQKNELHEAAEAWEKVLVIAAEIERRGGVVMVVGGTVRDELFNVPAKDFDLEVYHLPEQEIRSLLEPHGKVEEDIGRAFPVIKLWFGRSQLDVALPRRDSKQGAGHKGIKAVADPNMSVAEAVRRRDFTINALVKNPVSGEIIDYVGGLNDITEKKLRVVDPRQFTEDPLRVLRGIQFAARFGLTTEPDTKKLMAETIPTMNTLPRERFRDEWEKLFVKGIEPSRGLALAREVGVFANYPEIQALKETMQNPEFHPEGDVWTHTMMVVDGAAKIAERNKVSDEERMIVMLGAFGHDVGKATTTVTDPTGRIRSNGHDQAGVEPMRRWMTDQGFSEKKIIAKVLPIIKEHMHPTDLYDIDRADGLGDGPIQRIARRLHPATIQELVMVGEADHFGRSLPVSEYKAGAWLLERAQKLAIDQKKPSLVIEGQELLDIGYPPGYVIGEIIRTATRLQEEKNMTSPEIMEILKKHKKPVEGLAQLKSLL